MCPYSCIARRGGDRHGWSMSVEGPCEHSVPVSLAEIDPKVSALRNCFADEPIYLQVVDALPDLDQDKPVQEKRSCHRAMGYQLDEGKLWRVDDGRPTQSRSRVECASQTEAVGLAREEYFAARAWAARSQASRPHMQSHLKKSIARAILGCGRCKAFN